MRRSNGKKTFSGVNISTLMKEFYINTYSKPIRVVLRSDKPDQYRFSGYILENDIYVTKISSPYRDTLLRYSFSSCLHETLETTTRYIIKFEEPYCIN